MRVSKILILLSISAFLLKCSEENNHFPNNLPPNYPNYVYPKVDTRPQYKIFSDSGHCPVLHPEGDRIIFYYDPDWENYIASINPEGGDLNILYESRFALCFNSISNDNYLVFSNYWKIFYFKIGEESVDTGLEGDWPTVYGNLSGIYNIAYTKYLGNYYSDIYISDINGSPPIKILDDGAYGALSWSPDGKLLIAETDL
jgi:Tol biopolymer transport system component